MKKNDFNPQVYSTDFFFVILFSFAIFVSNLNKSIKKLLHCTDSILCVCVCNALRLCAKKRAVFFFKNFS